MLPSPPGRPGHAGPARGSPGSVVRGEVATFGRSQRRQPLSERCASAPGHLQSPRTANHVLGPPPFTGADMLPHRRRPASARSPERLPTEVAAGRAPWRCNSQRFRCQAPVMRRWRSGSGSRPGRGPCNEWPDSGGGERHQVLHLGPTPHPGAVEMAVVGLVEDDDSVAGGPECRDVVGGVVDVQSRLDLGLGAQEAEVAVGDRCASSHSTVSVTRPPGGPSSRTRRCVMMRIQTPASESRHRPRRRPSMTAMSRNMRRSSTAMRWSRS